MPAACKKFLQLQLGKSLTDDATITFQFKPKSYLNYNYDYHDFVVKSYYDTYDRVRVQSPQCKQLSDESCIFKLNLYHYLAT